MKRIHAAAMRGFSIESKPAHSNLTNAWDGYDDRECGRVVVLNSEKLAGRDTFLWAGTIAHKLTHVAGYFHDGERRDRHSNECTVPHLLDDVAEWTAWDLTHPAGSSAPRYTAYERVCKALAEACRADAAQGCVVAKGETP